MLSYKPGSTPRNLLSEEFPTHALAFQDYVLNDPTCPQFLKDEYEEANKDDEDDDEVEGSKASDDSGSDDTDSEDEIDFGIPEIPSGGVELNEHLDQATVDLFQALRSAHLEHQLSDDEDSNYGDGDFLVDNEAHDWSAAWRELGWDDAMLQRANSFLHNCKFEGLPPGEDVDLSKYDPKLLNEEQRVFYDMLTQHIVALMNEDEALRPEPLKLIVQGGAGVGKTHTLNTILKFVLDMYGANSNIVKTAAPTGSASFAIGGKTIHDLLQIPVTKQANQAMDDLTGDALMRLQMKLEGTKVLVIDEMSMISPGFLYKINRRLQEAFPNCKDQPFGGVCLILMGDFAQLPPVMSQPMYTVSSRTFFIFHNKDA